MSQVTLFLVATALSQQPARFRYLLWVTLPFAQVACMFIHQASPDVYSACMVRMLACCNGEHALLAACTILQAVPKVLTMIFESNMVVQRDMPRCPSRKPVQLLIMPQKDVLHLLLLINVVLFVCAISPTTCICMCKYSCVCLSAESSYRACGLPRMPRLAAMHYQQLMSCCKPTQN